ncbi:hypothetical protein EUTSA_v10007934mg [Eutrema salsugineum]|uniref:Uncharacterized protein n=1 Tax=Eutrema salsugineum TaxID=72664 RepID=V4KX66_EUTSA|nr:uncharacterized protein LOC18992787 [Eutrema salsugineum]ESQ34642.1 hypothetical protein EUTSA_v10007934mg [Eutrema salsugineum]
MRPVKKEPIMMDLDNDDECMMDTEQTDTSIKSGEANPSNMQRHFCAANDDADGWDNTNIDHQCMKLLDSFREDGDSYMRDNPLRSLRYDVDNGGYDNRVFKAVTNKQRSREDGNTIRVTKKNVESRKTSKRKTRKEAVPELRRREKSPAATEKSVEARVITSRVKRRNSQHNVEARKKKNSDGQMIPDESYRFYLKSLVEKSKSSRTNPEKEIQVKCEEDTMSLSDSDIIAVGDRPFMDEEDSPFVPSKSYKVVDLEEGSVDQTNSWFKKEIMNVLKQPYNEEEFNELYNEASVCRASTRCLELRDGRDLSYTPTDKTRPSYLDMYPKLQREVEYLREKDRRHRALNLLRGFIFYLKNVARHDAFKPWRNRECMKIRCP